MRKKKKPQRKPKKGDPITPRELGVLLLICKELPPAAISKKLDISEKTFFNHRDHLKSKIGAKTNIGLYKYAISFRKLKL